MPLFDVQNVVWVSSKGVTNNTTPQTVITDPGAGNPSYICPEKSFGFLNEDTAAVTMILRITGGTTRVVERILLNPNDKFVNSTGYVISAGETLTVELSGAVAATQPTWQAGYYQII